MVTRSPARRKGRQKAAEPTTGAHGTEANLPCNCRFPFRFPATRPAWDSTAAAFKPSDSV